MVGSQSRLSSLAYLGGDEETMGYAQVLVLKNVDPRGLKHNPAGLRGVGHFSDPGNLKLRLVRAGLLVSVQMIPPFLGSPLPMKQE